VLPVPSKVYVTDVIASGEIKAPAETVEVKVGSAAPNTFVASAAVSEMATVPKVTVVAEDETGL
jgi:hypothetical protein